MSIRKLLRWTLLSIILTMVLGYTWLMEENLASGVLLSSQIRLNRHADAWMASLEKAPLSQVANDQGSHSEEELPPADGTPRVYSDRSSLPLVVQQALPAKLSDGQITRVEIDEVGFLNIGYLVHLFRVSPHGRPLHLVQRLVLAEHEEPRVRAFDATMYTRALFPALFFVLGSACMVYVFGRRVATSTTKLLRWSEGLSIEELPDGPIELPFEEMQQIAAGTLASLCRERDAIEHRHRFLRFASHELRTPLAIACANTELLARHGVGAEAAPALARLEASVKDMKQLSDALLWLGRGEAPLPEPEPVDLVVLVNGVIQENRAVARSNEVVVDLVSVPSSPVIATRVLLSILVSNLLSNAVRYTQQGRVEIHLGSESLTIENRGQMTGGEGQGHGLGLQLVAWVVERAHWRWKEERGPNFRRHTVSF